MEHYRQRSLKFSSNPSPVMLFNFYLFGDAYCEGSPRTHWLPYADPSWTLSFNEDYADLEGTESGNFIVNSLPIPSLVSTFNSPPCSLVIIS